MMINISWTCLERGCWTGSSILSLRLTVALLLILVQSQVREAHKSHEIDKINLPWCGLATKKCDDDDGRRIAHGDTAEVGQFPYYVQLVKYKPWDNIFSPWQHFCGSTIITPRVLLTAAHCVDDKDIDEILRKGNIKGLAGSNYNGYGVDVAIQDVVIYHSNTQGDHHDAALLFLQHPVPGVDNPLGGPICSPSYRYRPNTVCLPQPGHDFGDYVSFTALGYGRYEGEGHGTQNPPRLQYVTLHTPSPSARRILWYIDCNKPHGLCNGTYEIATHDGREKRHRKSACKGDSGGPLVWIGPHHTGRGKPRATLAGFLSRGSNDGCLSSQDYWGKVSFYMNWITSEIQKYFDTHE